MHRMKLYFAFVITKKLLRVRLRSRGSARSIGALLVMLFAATACGPDRIVGAPSAASGVEPPSKLAPGTTGPSFEFMVDSDECSDPFGWWCHYQNEIEYYFEDLFCEGSGCRTWPLAQYQPYKNAYLVALGRIKNTPECAYAKPFLNTLHNNGRIRYYNQSDGDYADFHYSHDTWQGSPDYMGKIHIYGGTFSMGIELARTIVHEAWHGMYGPDDVAAEASAQSCVI